MPVAALRTAGRGYRVLRSHFPGTILTFSVLLIGFFLLGVVGEFAAALTIVVIFTFMVWMPLLAIGWPALWLVEGARAIRVAPSGSTVIAAGARVAVNHSSYQAIIAEARESGDEQWYAEAHGIIYNVDAGPPVRVAFHPGGMLDNWSAIVFDPTGDVMLADGFDSKTGEFAAPDRVTKLFYGDLVSCRPLWNDYYSCGFT